MVTGSMEDIPVEEAILTGVAHDRSEAKVTVVGLDDTPARPPRCSAPSPMPTSTSTWCSRTSRRWRPADRHHLHAAARGPVAVEKLNGLREVIGFSEVLYDDHIGKVSLVGAGMRSHPASPPGSARLAEAGINIELISTSEIRISVLIRDTDLDRRCASCTTPSIWAATKKPSSTPGRGGSHGVRIGWSARPDRSAASCARCSSSGTSR